MDILKTPDIPILSLKEAIALLVTCSLFVHLVYNRFEVEPASFIPTFILLVAIPFVPFIFISQHFESFLTPFFATYLAFYVTLALSIVSYRLSPFHPLAKYPGPRLAKISKFWNLFAVLSGKQHVIFKDLHTKHGSIIRVGPNELSINDVDLIPPVLGTNGMPKGPAWDARRIPGTYRSIISIRQVHVHADRRKIWNRAFNTLSIKDYEPVVERRALQLIERLEAYAQNNEVIDLKNWMSFFSFDFMGDMAFGGGFELMKEGDKEGLWKMVEDGLKALALLHNVPWIAAFLFKIPKSTEDVARVFDFANRQLKRRQNQEIRKGKDLVYYLAREDLPESEQTPFEHLSSDAATAMVAGSDTTSTVLSGIFYYLMINPSAFSNLKREVDKIFPPGEAIPLNASKLAEMPYLNACINEGLRLQPPVPTNLQRAPEVGSGGRMVGSHFIPEGCAVNIPPYAMHRDPRYFSPYPDKFWPERWLSQEKKAELSALEGKDEMTVITNSSAFIPFSVGPANCAGKNLALIEMRLVVALVVHKFDLQFADGYDPARWEEELQDFFVTKLGDLPIKLTARH